MRILVTGVSGQVGAAVAARLASYGKIVAADRNILDLSKPHDISRALDAIEPDIIVNPAAYTAVDRAEDEPDLAFVVNATAPEVIARWAAARGVPLMHFSTDYVFDGSGEMPWREDDQPNPLSVYGASKLAGETAVRAAGGPHLIIRTSWVYSAGGMNFLRTIASNCRRREELRVVADQIGGPTSAECITDAIAGIFARGIDSLANNFASAGGLVHVAAHGTVSWHGFASMIVTGLEARGLAVTTRQIVPITTPEYPTKAVRPLNSRFDLSRLEHVFGIIPMPWTTYAETELDRYVAAGS